MADGDDNWNPAGDMTEAEIHQGFALAVFEQKLLGIIGKDAKPVDSLIDHAVKHAALTVEIEISIVVKRGRRHRKNTLVSTRTR